MKISRIKNLIAAPESAFHIELTNDSSLVNCDYEGNPVEGAAYETSTILLYYGGKDAWNDFNVTIQTSGITASLDRNTHVITPSNIRYDKAVITVTAAHKTRSGLVLTATYTLAKNKPGQPGEKAVSYSLIPSLHVIRKDSNGTLLDKQISFVVHKRVGSALTVITTYKQLFENVLDIKIGEDDGAYIGDSSKGDKEIVANTADFWKGDGALLVRLEHEVDTDLCYDCESIGVVTNGEDGVSYFITSTVASIRANENGVPFAPEQSIEVSEWKRIGKTPAVKSDDLKMTLYTVKGSDKQHFGQENWAPTAHFTASSASGCDSLQAELTDSAGNVVFSLPIPVEWQGKTGTDGVTYEILPSVANIRADGDGNVLTGVIQITAYKIKGETRKSCGVGMATAIGVDGTELPFYWVQYKIDSGSWTSCSNIAINAGGFQAFMGYGVPASAVSTVKTGIAFRLLYGTSSSNTVVHETAALQVVKDGQKGAQGKTGRYYYYDGYFDSTKEYTATDHQAPYVAFDWTDKQTVNNVEVDVVRTSYYMLVADTNKQGSTYVAPRTTSATGVWEQMETSFKFLIGQAFFTEFGKLGSAVFSGDWMISQYGTPGIVFVNDEKNVLNTIVNTRKVSLETLATLKNANGTYKTTDSTYTALRNYYTEAKLQKAIDQSVWAVDNEATLEQLLAMSTTSYQLFGVDEDNPFKLFAPNIALDFLVGKAYLHDADIQGSIYALSGIFKNVVIDETCTVKGKLDGVSGSFVSLGCLDNNGEVTGGIRFSQDLMTFYGGTRFEDGAVVYGKLYNQGPDARFYSADIFCRGLLGARSMATAVVINNKIRYYYEGLGENKYAEVTLSSKTEDGKTVFTIPLFAGSSSGASGFPVSVVLLKPSGIGTYYYKLEGQAGAKVTVANINDDYGNVYIAMSSGFVQWNGGEVAECFNAGSYITPTSENAGAGWLVGAFRDNNW